MFQGILGNVTIQIYNEPYYEELSDWTITGYSFENFDKLKQLADTVTGGQGVNGRGMAIHGPVIFKGNLIIDSSPIRDTYIDMTGWGKVRNRFLSYHFDFS